MNRYIRLNDESIVISIRYGSVLVTDEIESELGELGQKMQEDGTFIDVQVTPIPQPYEPSNSEIAKMISDLQADLIIAGVM